VQDEVGAVALDVTGERLVLQILAAVAIRLDQDARIFLVRAMPHWNDRRRPAVLREMLRLVAHEFDEIPAGRVASHELDHVREGFRGACPDDVQPVTVRPAQVEKHHRVLAAGKRQHGPLRGEEGVADDLAGQLKLGHGLSWRSIWRRFSG
jgi:hypothetical protein